MKDCVITLVVVFGIINILIWAGITIIWVEIKKMEKREKERRPMWEVIIDSTNRHKGRKDHE